jgi:hypothetical protein
VFRTVGVDRKLRLVVILTFSSPSLQPGHSSLIGPRS